MNNYTLIVKNKFLSALNEYSMTDGVSHIVVGFSGGADSLCLLHLLNSYRSEFGYELTAVHINHGIRGEEAARDAYFCESFCEEQGITFKLFEVDCVSRAEELGLTVEECGRMLRYDIFNNLCLTDGYRIATAHNANDNAETLLFNLARGTGLKGASGIPRVRGNIIRPVIFCSREEIEGYCNENNLQFVTDSTNLCDDYTRNKIRHGALSVLSEVNYGAVKNIAAFTENVGDVCDFLKKQTAKELLSADLGNGYYDSDYIFNLHKALRSECIITLFNKMSNATLDRQKVNEIINLLVNKGRIQVYSDIYAECIKNRFRFFEFNTAISDAEIFIDFQKDNVIDFNNYVIKISKLKNNSKKVNKNILDNFVDCDKIVGSLKIRTRQEGDRITLVNRNVSKSLKKLFNENSVPIEERNRIPVLCDDVGIVWVYSVGTDARCRINNNSTNIISIGGENND